jgi:hypothetical protein
MHSAEVGRELGRSRARVVPHTDCSRKERGMTKASERLIVQKVSALAHLALST